MVDIGINYLAGNDECYKILKKHNIINTIKFPGRICDYNHMESCLKLAKELNLKVDLHGLPGMTPAFSCMSDKFIENVDWIRLKEVFNLNNSITRISTHVGLEHKDSFDNYDKEDVRKKWHENYQNLKKHMEDLIGKNIDIGLENIPGGFKYDERSLTPEYVSENWKLSDFGVYDVTHAKLAAKTLNMDFSEYLDKLTYREKVKIYHVSGNNDETGMYDAKPDKHILLSESEIEDIIKCRELFKNLDLIVSEYSFQSKYSIEKEIFIEAVVLHSIVIDGDAKKAKAILMYLKKKLKDDISNAEEVLNYINMVEE